jgi:hypothetical protein
VCHSEFGVPKVKELKVNESREFGGKAMTKKLYERVSLSGPGTGCIRFILLADRLDR